MGIENIRPEISYVWKDRWNGGPCACDSKHHKIVSSGFDVFNGGETTWQCENCGHTWQRETYWETDPD